MFLTVFILFRKIILAIPHSLLKGVICSREVISDSPWCNNSYCVYQKLGQNDLDLFDQENVSFFSIYSLPIHKKCSHKKNHAYLNLVQSICHRMDLCRLLKPDVFFLLLFLISSPPSNAALRFTHSSSIKISLGKSTRFSIPSI